LSVWQAKARDAREQRRAQLTAAHSYIIGMVANYLDLDHNFVEEFIVDDIKVRLLHTNFSLSHFQITSYSSRIHLRIVTLSVLLNSLVSGMSYKHATT